MTKPYTYCLTHIRTNRKYYGVRYADNCTPEDLWTTYFTSSKYVHRIIEREGKTAFSYEIRKIFQNALEAREWEHKVLRRLKVREKIDWINQSDGRLLGSSRGNHKKHKPLSEETKKLLSKLRKGKPKPEGFGKKVSARQTGSKNHSFGKKQTPEHIEKRISKIRGMPKSESFKEYMSHCMRKPKSEQGRENIRKAQALRRSKERAEK